MNTPGALDERAEDAKTSIGLVIVARLQRQYNPLLSRNDILQLQTDNSVAFNSELTPLRPWKEPE